MAEESKGGDPAEEAALLLAQIRAEKATNLSFIGTPLEDIPLVDLHKANKNTIIAIAQANGLKITGSKSEIYERIYEKRRNIIELIQLAGHLANPPPPDSPEPTVADPNEENEGDPPDDPFKDFTTQSEDGGGKQPAEGGGDDGGNTKDGGENPPIPPTAVREQQAVPQSTPSGRSVTSEQLSLDVAGYVHENLVKAGLVNDLEAKMDERDAKITKALDARLRQQDSKLEEIRKLIIGKDGQTPPAVDPPPPAPTEDSPSMAAAEAASAHQKRQRRDASPNMLEDPPRFRGRNVNLSPVGEHSSKSHATQISHKPPSFGSPAGRWGSKASAFQPRSDISEMSEIRIAPLVDPPIASISRILPINSPLKDVRLGKYYYDYLGGEKGREQLDLMCDSAYLEQLGFDPTVHEDILQGRRILLDTWTPPNITMKYMANIHKLEELTIENFIDFYTHITFDLQRYNIGLIPFDAIVLKWQHVGLCYPGVGQEKYLLMAESLFNVLEYILPADNSIVKDCTTSLVGSAHDGYRLLRAIMSRAIPVFCRYRTIDVPRWSKYKDIARMAKLWKINFRLQAKSGAKHSEIQQSLLFLESLSDPALLAQVTSIRGQIQQFAEGLSDFDSKPQHLPTNLTIEGIVATLTEHPTSLDSSISYARASHTHYMQSSSDEESLDFQGLSMNVTSSDRRGQNRRIRSQRPSTADKRATSDGNDEVVCRGCHKKKHTEVDCRRLAEWIIISKAVEALHPSKKKKVLTNYYKFYGTAPPAKAMVKSYTRQFREFCANRHMTEEQVVNNYNWDGYCAADLDVDDEGFVSAEEEVEASE